VAFGVTFLGYKMEPDMEALLIQLRALHFENPDQQVVIHGFNRVEGIESQDNDSQNSTTASEDNDDTPDSSTESHYLDASSEDELASK